MPHHTKTLPNFHMSESEPATCHFWTLSPLLFIETAKNRVRLLNFKKPSKMLRMTRRTPPHVNYLKINTAKNRISLYVNDIILIEFDFLNLNLGPRAYPTKNRKFLHVARKSVIGHRIMQGPILYAQNCSKLSSGPLKPRLLKSRDTCCM
jgi:hypothetical protein